jgi:hypothetical protein
VTGLIIVIAICIVLALCFFFWSRQRAAARSEAIRHYATEHNFNLLGSSLPAGLSLEGSSFRSAELILNAFTGSGREKEFAFFDCYIREGRRGYTQSVLAIHRLGGSYPACRFDRQLLEERAPGEWTFIYHHRRAWPVEEIDAHLSSL